MKRLFTIFKNLLPHIDATKMKRMEGEPFWFDHLSDEEALAFATLKNRRSSPPIPNFPHAEGDFTLHTNACGLKVSYILLQAQLLSGGRETNARVIFIAHVSQPQLNYSTNDHYILSVVCALLLFRPYLNDIRFTVRTYQSELRWNINLAESTGRLT